MQRGKATHRESNDMSLDDREPIEHGADIVARLVLGIFLAILGHVGGRIAPRIEGDTAIAAGEPAVKARPPPLGAGKTRRENAPRARAPPFTSHTRPPRR